MALSSLKNAFIRTFIRLLMPDLAESLRVEGESDLSNRPFGENLDSSLYLEVEDNAADVTIVAFAGMALLYAAMPKFEFRKLLREGGRNFNLVFVRDIHRSAYNLAPDGSDKGVEFYERVVGETLHRLGSSCNIALGASAGADAAFCISGAAPIHKIIAFNPVFPIDHYGSRGNLVRVVGDVRKLVRDPGAYCEVLFTTWGVRYLWKQLDRRIGRENIADTLQRYLRRHPPVPATVFYSRDCWPDTQQASRLGAFPSISLRAVASARHNCMAELRRRGELGRMIQSEIDAVLAQHHFSAAPAL